MKYHPHGDASITEAIVQMAKKICSLIPKNWGNVYTGILHGSQKY
jgi:topoisomerase-4 subunit A